MRGVCLKGRAQKGHRMCRLQRKEFYVGVSGHTAQVPKRSSLEFSAFPCIGSSFRIVAETDDKGSGILRASFWKCLMEMGRGDLQVSSLQKTACSAVKQLDAKSLAQSFQGEQGSLPSCLLSFTAPQIWQQEGNGSPLQYSCLDRRAW